MNILPIVITIVLILGMFSLSQFQRNSSLKQDRSTYIAYFRGLRETRNKLEETAYLSERKSLMKEKVKPTPKKSKNENKERKAPLFFRDKKLGWSEGRLNLSSLLEENKISETLLTLAADYLTELYGHAEFFPSDPIPLLNLLISKLKKGTELVPLQELELNNEALYKMLRGTHTYDLKKQVGYPPFNHFFTFEKRKGPPINFKYANEILLQVVLGKETTHALIKMEKEKQANKPLKKRGVCATFK